MNERFIQRRLELNVKESLGFISIKQLCNLIEGHPYEKNIFNVFKLDSILDESITIKNIDTVFYKIQSIKKNYHYFKIQAETNQISFKYGNYQVEGIPESNPLMFRFDEYIDQNGEILSGLEAFALYESKSTYFDSFSMTKYANMLFDNDLVDLANYNLAYFKKESKKKEGFNKHRSYRLVEHNDEIFVRGITSGNYNEYGVDFTFVTSMLLFHNYMKQNPGNNYAISFAALNESKMELILSSNEIKDAGDFGKISSAISVSTNDLGKGALSFINIIKLHTKGTGIYLYPENGELAKKNVSINHTTGVNKTLEILSCIEDVYNYSNLFLNELSIVKNIKNPDDLRIRILNKIEHPNSSFKDIKNDLKNIFSKSINNEITDFAKLLEMCNKAEELDINYDLKDKLRVVISKVILNN
ncbi:hypothetical protein [Pedobacter glucosidilyticus]|uniref:hypothetical protein n=1 Tax=Pedobacter glucosidilyticus TaxID=1122941 RepID=UPI0026F29BF1|nr:hypothetical protein [Pedobacter glucosidilyticus]